MIANKESSMLVEQWSEILDLDGVAPIKNAHRRAVTAQLLENQKEVAIKEPSPSLMNVLSEDGPLSVSANLGGPLTGPDDDANIQGLDPVLIALVRRAMPHLLAFDVCGVQAMKGPTGLIFALSSIYEDNPGSSGNATYGLEALFDEADTTFSGGNTITRTYSWEFNESDGSPNNLAHVSGGANTRADESANDLAIANASQLVAFGRLFGQIWGDTSQTTTPGGSTAVTADETLADYATRVVAYANPAMNSLANGNNQFSASGGVITETTRYAEPFSTQEAETSDDFPEMALSIRKTTIEAQTRQIKAEYSRELAQDLQAVHGLDAEKELASMLSNELLAAINRHVLHVIYRVAKLGAQAGTALPGTINLSSNADTGGARWEVERHKHLHFAITRDMNAIGKETRRGIGNLLICSTDIAAALAAADALSDSGPKDTNFNQMDETQNTYVGMLKGGKIKVFVDPYIDAGIDFYVAGYKGSQVYDAGIFYCPYVPFQMLRAVGQDTFQPKIAFKTRYGVTANPHSSGRGSDVQGINPHNNTYYRKVRVNNL